MSAVRGEIAARDVSSAAGRGLFVFLETGRQGSPTYHLEAIPANPLVASTLPPAILRAVTCVRFRVSFADVTVLVPPDHVPCST